MFTVTTFDSEYFLHIPVSLFIGELNKELGLQFDYFVYVKNSKGFLWFLNLLYQFNLNLIFMSTCSLF